MGEMCRPMFVDAQQTEQRQISGNVFFCEQRWEYGFMPLEGFFPFEMAKITLQ